MTETPELKPEPKPKPKGWRRVWSWLKSGGSYLLLMLVLGMGVHELNRIGDVVETAIGTACHWVFGDWGWIKW